MIKVLLFILLIQASFAKVTLELEPDVTVISQGEIFTGRLILTEGSVPNYNLRGKTIGKSLYILSIEPFIARQGAGLEAQGRMIFSQVPEASVVSEIIAGDELTISWRSLAIKPTESQSFLLGNFEIPFSLRLLPLVLWMLGISIVFILGYLGYRRWRRKREKLRRRKEIREQLLVATSYDEVVQIWKLKHTYLSEFPQLESAYKDLEHTLFKYQFKPSRSMMELEKVMEAYEHFKTAVIRGSDGI